MNMRSLIPWSRSENSRALSGSREDTPFLALHREVNRLFDRFFDDFDAPARFAGWPSTAFLGWSGSWPKVEVAESEKEIRLVAEVPGLDENDVEVLLDGDVVTLRGEKKAETEDKDRQFSERFYGRFERSFALGAEVEEDKVAARFKNGVLTVTLPKTERARTKAKRIAINGRQ